MVSASGSPTTDLHPLPGPCCLACQMWQEGASRPLPDISPHPHLCSLGLSSCRCSHRECGLRARGLGAGLGVWKEQVEVGSGAWASSKWSPASCSSTMFQNIPAPQEEIDHLA